MPKQSVVAAGAVMAVAALLGIYFGVSRSLTAPGVVGDEAGVVVPPVTPISSAKPILTPPSTMDEAEVRRLAREEAQAILAKPAVHKAAPKDDADDDNAPVTLTPVEPPAVPAAPKPAASTPPG